ncbi:phage major capsid protein [Salinicoccus halodurans]|uniref:Phage major capsid protein, HK97 family n=1 Tax=Salinicoccus halodurans TaxID=407035 RepID=A0A0F7HMX4_9STAP|nr:phage major capsid protein [Salinicoccus halodurans]AKG74369.1 hypothetical protein AAT16_09055 [Salinicoccus halodurans]SFK95048.1 phage major capsid protein, HK97 family [Salinicoccus halodurans]
MTIKFKDDVEGKVSNLRDNYFEAVENNEDPEVVKEKYANYMSAFSNTLKEELLVEARREALDTSTDSQVKMSRGQNVLTAAERKFFTNLVEDQANMDTYKEEVVLPESTVLRVFDDLKRERPLLNRINFTLAGIKTRIIVGDPSGAAKWGELFGKIQGQIQANFKEISFAQNKLTAFAIVPKDFIEFGPEWVERYVREQLVEAMAHQLEYGVVTGGGATTNQPIGLLKDMTTDEDGNVTSVTDKASVGTLTFADSKTTALELAQLMTGLSTKENGKPYNVAGKVFLLVNPQDQFLVQAQYTMQTQNGAWVTSLPYNLEVVASEHIAQGKLAAVVGPRYYAVMTGESKIKEYDQTLALEDANVYIAKQFAHGIPDDNKVVAVYNLDIAGMTTTTTTASTTTTTTAGA